MGRSHQTLNIKIGDHTLNQVQSFKYLGSTVNGQSTQEEEITNRGQDYKEKHKLDSKQISDKVTSFLSTDCELSTGTCSKNIYSLGPSIAKYSQNVGCMYRLLKDRNVPKKAKQIIHQTIVRPTLIFESECWTLTKRLEQQITTVDMNVISMIHEVTRWDRKRKDTRGHQMGQKEK